MCALLVAAVVLAAQPATPFRTVGSFQTATVTYGPGEADPPGNHGYDIVLVPIDEGMTVEVDGARVDWVPGLPVLISRGAAHVVRNASDHTVSFVEVRTIGDSAAGNDATVAAAGATIVRSVVGKYVRATVWRLEQGAHVEWPASVEGLLVLRAAGGPSKVLVTSLLDQKKWDNLAGEAIEIVRISRMAAAAPQE